MAGVKQLDRAPVYEMTVAGSNPAASALAPPHVWRAFFLFCEANRRSVRTFKACWCRSLCPSFCASKAPSLPPHACADLGIERGTLQHLPEVEFGTTDSFMLTLDGKPRLVRLVPWSLRERGFGVGGDPLGLVDRRERLWRGTVEPGGLRISCTRLRDGWWGRVVGDNGQSWILEPWESVRRCTTPRMLLHAAARAGSSTAYSATAVARWLLEREVPEEVGVCKSAVSPLRPIGPSFKLEGRRSWTSQSPFSMP